MNRRVQVCLFSVLLVLISCADKKEKSELQAKAPIEEGEATPGEEVEPGPIANPAEAATASCKVQSAELREFLGKLVDKSAKVDAPWPTGDAKLDARIEESRAELREFMKPLDPAAKVPELSDGINSKPDEEMYRDCPQGLKALQAVGDADADKRNEAFINIADAVEACDCKVNIPWLKAAYYLGQRGPD